MMFTPENKRDMISEIGIALSVYGFTGRRGNLVRAEGNRVYRLTFSKQRSWTAWHIILGLDFAWINRDFRLSSALGCVIQLDLGNSVNALVEATGRAVDFDSPKMLQTSTEKVLGVLVDGLIKLRDRELITNIANRSGGNLPDNFVVAPSFWVQLDATRNRAEDWWL